MEYVEPKVYKIAETKVIDDDVVAWLTDLGGEACLAHVNGEDAEKLVELAGRRCYKSYVEGLNPNVKKTRKDSKAYHENVLRSGHGSVLEHSVVSFAFENVSRVFTHELVRHRAGTAMSQESLRYVRLTDLKFWMPSVFEKCCNSHKFNEAKLIIEETLRQCELAQRRLAEIYEIDEMKDFNLKKQLTSAFRRVAPIGLATGIVFTANLRAWRHIIEMRTSEHAEEELRLVLGQVAEILQRDYPLLFGDYASDNKQHQIGAFETPYPKV